MHVRSSSYFVVRLQFGNAPTNGRVEVFHEGRWGTICDVGWEDQDADVLCRSLDFDSGYVWPRNTVPSGNGTIWLTNIECSGTEQRLSECAHSEWGLVGQCTHYADAGAQCSKLNAYLNLCHDECLPTIFRNARFSMIWGNVACFFFHEEYTFW